MIFLSYSFSTKTADTAYSSCHVIYTDPNTKETIEATYTPENANSDGQTLEVKRKVSSLHIAIIKLLQSISLQTTTQFYLYLVTARDIMRCLLYNVFWKIRPLKIWRRR